MVLIQLLLPTPPAGARDALTPLDDTRRELAGMFDGVTAYLRSPAKGLWTAPDGHTEADDVVMVEVVTETFDRGWWRTYAAKLAPTLPGTNLAASPVSMASTSPKRE